tara:strand:- start:758 stop:1045 length:288 start_codon:yes stop_codon:yes gene_type:complete
MNLTREQSEIIMTALNNYRGELYINDNDTTALGKVSDLIRSIEDAMKSKDVGQKKIPIANQVSDGHTEIGSETGIEEEYNKMLPLPEVQKCEVCD